MHAHPVSAAAACVRRVFTLGSAVASIPWTALYVYLGTFSTNLVDLAQVRGPPVSPLQAGRGWACCCRCGGSGARGRVAAGVEDPVRVRQGFLRACVMELQATAPRAERTRPIWAACTGASGLRSKGAPCTPL